MRLLAFGVVLTLCACARKDAPETAPAATKQSPKEHPANLTAVIEVEADMTGTGPLYVFAKPLRETTAITPEMNKAAKLWRAHPSREVPPSQCIFNPNVLLRFDDGLDFVLCFGCGDYMVGKQSEQDKPGGFGGAFNNTPELQALIAQALPGWSPPASRRAAAAQ